MSEKIEKNAKDVFKEYIENIPVKDYDFVKSEIISKCYINYYTFRRWSKGLQQIPIIYFEKINSVAGYELLKIENNGKTLKYN